tara:strand:- start:585 stop:833 length:249 start_codon:yes stop_codon:yes gene_type:complete
MNELHHCTVNDEELEPCECHECEECEQLASPAEAEEAEWDVLENSNHEKFWWCPKCRTPSCIDEGSHADMRANPLDYLPRGY